MAWRRRREVGGNSTAAKTSHGDGIQAVCNGASHGGDEFFLILPRFFPETHIVRISLISINK